MSTNLPKAGGIGALLQALRFLTVLLLALLVLPCQGIASADYLSNPAKVPPSTATLPTRMILSQEVPSWRFLGNVAVSKVFCNNQLMFALSSQTTFCERIIMLASAFMPIPKNPSSLAGMGDAVGEFRVEVPAARGKMVEDVAALETPPFKSLIEAVISKGVAVDLHGTISTLLDLTEDENRFLVRQVAIGSKSERRYINVGKLKGRNVVVAFAVRMDGEKELDHTFYRSSENATLEKALYIKDRKLTVLTGAQAEDGWQKHKDFWIKRLVKTDKPGKTAQ